MFASMGFYPVNPVSGAYLLCSPIFDDVSLKLSNDKHFTTLRMIKKVFRNNT
ncbi:glycoside hydrolase domain-containing protein [Pedobacter frigidisoli]|uniref:glycoside hydrolase domain-containing protein n=1 Tax=Pedobacter frigidisoli TaxID=2530455 RepID=UPI002931C228|nr:glycoside hydrolase domain-containing protein [Pedobacter frigidisoli]